MKVLGRLEPELNSIRERMGTEKRTVSWLTSQSAKASTTPRRLREQATAPGAAANCKVAPAERDAKMAALKQKLSGAVSEGPLEPGRCVLDLACQLRPSNVCKFVNLEKCLAVRTKLLTRID